MAGVRKANRRGVTVVLLEPGAAVAGVFTANRFCAAPVQICREHLAAGSEVRAILVNTGNAMPAPAKTAWPGPARPVPRWPRGSAAPRRCCRFPPA